MGQGGTWSQKCALIALKLIGYFWSGQVCTGYFMATNLSKFTVTSKVLNRCPQSVRNVQLSDQTLTCGSPERLPLARPNELHARTDDWNVGHACLGNILPVGTQQILQDDSWLEHFVPATSSRPTTALSCRHSPLDHVTGCLLMPSQLMNVA